MALRLVTTCVPENGWYLGLLGVLAVAAEVHDVAVEECVTMIRELRESA